MHPGAPCPRHYWMQAQLMERTRDDDAGDCASSEKAYNQYRQQFKCGGVHRDPIGLNSLLHKSLLHNHDGIQTYPEIAQIIAAPYMFSDHANKSFSKQYGFLRRKKPELFDFKHDTTVQTFNMAQHARLGAHSPAHQLPVDIYKKIHEYARAPDPHDLLLRSMAFAANSAFFWYSD